MIRSLYCTSDGQVRTNLAADEFDAARQDPHGLLWVDLFGEPPEACEPILRHTFGFHPLAVDDALRETHVPRVDDWGAYLYLVLQAITFNHQYGGALEMLELDVFLGPNYLVTYREQPIAALEGVWSGCQRDERHLKKGAAHLLYELTDHLVAGYMPVVEEIDEVIDQIENQVFGHPEPGVLEQIFGLKRAVLELRRTLSPQREVLNKLARDDYAVVDARDRVYFRDVYDHLVRLYDINEGLRDLIGGALDTYLSVINNRMNDVMKTLTVITTLFMPISFLVGFFGMNFFQPVVRLEAWTGAPAFVLLLAATILLPTGMYFWMRRRGWM
jgi:magnesium transporter